MKINSYVGVYHSVFFPLIREGRGMLQLFTGAKSSLLNGRRPGYTLDESPAHRIAHCSRILRYVAQSRPRGAGIRTSDLLIISPPALPTELQPPL